MHSLKNQLTFEYPLNESIRICLRLENLFNQLAETLKDNNEIGLRAAISCLLQLIDLVDRPDLKSKLAQMLSLQSNALLPLQKVPHVNNEKLKSTLEQLDKLIESMHLNRNKIGEKLRSNDFLNQMRAQMSTPGGICNLKSPAFLIWLKKPLEECYCDLNSWAYELNDVKTIVEWILKLTRESSSPQVIEAELGFYSQALDTSAMGQLVRISLPVSLGIYPEVSIGRHRLTIHFLQPNFHENGRPTHAKKNVQFELDCCKL